MGLLEKLFGSKKNKSDAVNKEPEIEQPKTEQPKTEQPKTEQPKTEQPKTEQPKTEQPKIEQPETEQSKLDTNQLVFAVVKGRISKLGFETEYKNGLAVIAKLDTSIKAVLKDSTKQENDVIVKMDFTVLNSEFGEEGIFETLAGVGDSLKSAIGSCTDIFINTVLKVALDAIGGINASLDVETDVNGVKRVWNTYIGAIQTQGFEKIGSHGDAHVYDMLKAQIAKRLKRKRFYWVKLLVTKQVDGSTVYQCLLNNKPFLEGERILDEYVKQWPANNEYMIELQYIIIRQSDESYNENRQKDIDTEKFMSECAQYAIEVFENYKPEDSVEGLVNTLSKFTKDINFAWELFWFIPAIYCRLVLNGIKYTDTVILVTPDDRRFFGKLFDYDAYVVGVDAVIRDLQTNPNKSSISNIMALSNEFKALQKLMEEGKTAPENPQPMVLMAPKSYMCD